MAQRAQQQFHEETQAIYIYIYIELCRVVIIK